MNISYKNKNISIVIITYTLSLYYTGIYIIYLYIKIIIYIIYINIIIYYYKVYRPGIAAEK